MVGHALGGSVDRNPDLNFILRAETVQLKEGFVSQLLASVVDVETPAATDTDAGAGASLDTRACPCGIRADIASSQSLQLLVLLFLIN